MNPIPQILVAVALAGPLLAGDPVGEPIEPSTPLSAQDEAPPATWREALTSGKVWLKLRYRFETVDQDGFSRDADASTLRTVLGYETARYEGFAAVLEFESVSRIGDENYNSTTNGNTDRPVVADPTGSEVNQVYADWRGEDDLGVRAGRQRIVLDNQRFVGNVGWRQNEQTFDAATLEYTYAEIHGQYSFLKNVNRVFGDDSPVGDERMNSHLLNLGREVGALGKVTGYAYLLDYDDADAFSTNTFGLRLAGKTAFEDRDLNWLWSAEVATQDDSGDNDNNVDANYYMGEVGGKYDIATLKVGAELLEGSGDVGDSFQTPLATLHAFNGWADKFLVTPDNGLQDVYVSLGCKIKDLNLQAVYHDFDSDSKSFDYGTEIDLLATYPLAKDITVGVKYADYDADDFATDTQKFWVWMGFAF